MSQGATVFVRILGPVGLELDGEDQSLSHQQRSLLAVLVGAGGEVISADALSEVLHGRPTAASTIRTAVSRLRKLVGDRVTTEAGGYRLSLDADELDATRFEGLRRAAAKGSAEKRIGELSRATALWRGDAFGDLAELDGLAPVAARLDHARAVAIEDLAQLHLDVGDHSAALSVLAEHRHRHPLRERPVEQAMRALDAAARRPEALREYEDFRTRLRDETGLDPTAALRSVQADLFSDDAPSESFTRPEALPTGLLTFMFTDIVESTRRWVADAGQMSSDLAAHDDRLRNAVGRHGGTVFKHTGDGACAVFVDPSAAIDAALDIHRDVPLPVRIGIHTGTAELRDGDYFGPTLNLCARIMDAGHGGQTLLSATAAALCADAPLLDLGRHSLKGLPDQHRLHQVGEDRFPALRTRSERLGNLPAELTSFVGRDRQCADLVAAIDNHRLTTLIGVGGTGKTRLAIEAGRLVTEGFPDGCWLVELAAVTAPDDIALAVAAALGLRLAPDDDVTERILDGLAPRSSVLIIDNCEHLLGGAATLTEAILERAPEVKIVATSREPLMVRGEYLVPVPSLDAAAAVELFQERAVAERPDLTFDDEQLGATTELCRRLDFLPLAIELAASRVRAFLPSELTEMLDARFRLLVGGRRSRLERHQTLRRTLDWSYELLEPAEQLVFDRLSVFPAAFDLAAARSVASGDAVHDLDIVDIVPRLLDRSLLTLGSGSDGTTRYRMLETMRAYGREHLEERGESEARQGVHARYVAMTVGIGFLENPGPGEWERAVRLAEYVPDAFVALEWLLERHEWELAMHLVGVDYAHGDHVLTVIIDRIERAIDASGTNPPQKLEATRFNFHRLLRRTAAEIEALGWEAFRRDDPFPTTRFFRTPFDDILEVTHNQLGELFASLDRYEALPELMRRHAFYGPLCAANRVPGATQTEQYRAVFDELERLTVARGSDLGWSMFHYVAGARARAEGRLIDAVEQFQAGRDRAWPASWARARASWNAADAALEAGVVVDLEVLADDWRHVRRGRVDLQTPFGLLVSAKVLAHRGELDLARRFTAWIVDHGHVFLDLAAELDIWGLSIPEPSDEPEDLDVILGDLYELADAVTP